MRTCCIGTRVSVIDSGRRNPSPIGHCIYCGSTDGLTREHIVPYAFGGNWVLGEASCGNCAKITQHFEKICARDVYGPHRLQFGYRSRHKHERPTHVSLGIHAKGRRADRAVPIEALPTLPLVAPVFKIPGALSRSQPTHVARYRPWVWSVDQEDVEQKRRLTAIHENAAEQISIREKINVNALMRLLAKISYAGAIAEYGETNVSSPLPDYILGRDKNLPYFVGSSPNRSNTQGPPEMAWTVEFGIYDGGDKRYFTAKIELFRYLYTTPGYKGDRCMPYWVVISEANDELSELVLDPGARRGH